MDGFVTISKKHSGRVVYTNYLSRDGIDKPMIRTVLRANTGC